MNRFVRQPGPVAAERLRLVQSGGRRIEVTLAAGVPLEDAVADALAGAGVQAAWLEFTDAPVSELAYVIPAPSPDKDHAAWYSETYRFDAGGRIDRIGMIVGRHGAASFLHGHGLWTPAGGAQAMGHILAPQTVLEKPVRARGIGLTDAGFARGPDAETNFELFHVEGAGDTGGGYAALRIAPNTNFTEALAEARDRLGWQAARAHGVGSLIGTVFADGSALDSLPTEFLIRDVEVAPGAPPPEIVIVGVDGADIREGRLADGVNHVLITAEIVLERAG